MRGVGGQAARRAFASSTAALPLTAPVYGVWGAGTGVGKTLVAAGLAAAAQRAQCHVLYVKPAQTGFPADWDARVVSAAAGGPCLVGAHAAELLPREVRHVALGQQLLALGAPGTVQAHTLFAWRAAVGPHLAVEQEGRAVSDEQLLATTLALIRSFCAAAAGTPAVALVETAGGVASPAPSGRLQCDVLRPLRLPALLVAGGGLGGISATVSAAESLLLRGYDTAAVVMLEGGLKNEQALRQHLGRAADGTRLRPVRLHLLPPAPAPLADASAPAALQVWLQAAADGLDELHVDLMQAHEERMERLRAAAPAAARTLWWPFTQHAARAPAVVLDGRSGEHFAVLRQTTGPAASGAGGEELQPQVDACASWWTQGLPADMQPELTRAVAYAAGRWGHVMFAEHTHDAALGCAAALLALPGAGWAERVFFTDNGASSMEVAIKMALRKAMVDRGIDPLDPAAIRGPPPVLVALAGSYHGDTLGAMDAQAPSAFTGRAQSPWYQPRGLFLEPPCLALQAGRWRVSLPQSLALTPSEKATAGLAAELELPSRDAAFDLTARLAGPLATRYRSSIDAALSAAPDVSACLLEPVLHGAAGMILVDPLYQRVLADAARARGLPLVLDEVFAGLWRLGVASAARDLLGITPDIACFSKLLTGGTVPLAATLTTGAVFDAFCGPSKLSALLHGHSYTAHAVGCQAAQTALRLLADPITNANLSHYGGRLRELWPADRLVSLSHARGVARVVAIGTVLAVELQTEVGAAAGYSSDAARAVAARLRTEHAIYARPLGPVVYLMTGPASPPSAAARLLSGLEAVLARD